MALFSPLRQLCGRVDQETAEADLAAFIGPRADTYLRWYRSRRSRLAAGKTTALLEWNWTAFFSWFAWHWYRKLWIEGLLAALAPVLVGWLAQLVAGATASVVLFSLCYCLSCMLCRALVLADAAWSIAAAGGATEGAEARRARLARAGGVSWAGAAAASLILLGLTGWDAVAQYRQAMEMLQAAGLSLGG